MSAHEVLGLNRSASDEEIRTQYLKLVREYPPEKEPERFAEIRQAYEELRDPVTRMRQRLFNPEAYTPLEVLRDRELQRNAGKRIPTQVLFELADE